MNVDMNNRPIKSIYISTQDGEYEVNSIGGHAKLSLDVVDTRDSIQFWVVLHQSGREVSRWNCKSPNLSRIDWDLR